VRRASASALTSRRDSLAARRGSQNNGRNLTIRTADDDSAVDNGPQSAPIQPSGFSGQAIARNGNATAVPSFHPFQQIAPQHALRSAAPPVPTPAQSANAPSSSRQHFAPVPLTASANAFPPIAQLPPRARWSPTSAHAAGIDPNRQGFLQVFETFYDALADSRTLQSNLDEQLRRSSALINTLQQSAAAHEAMVDKRVEEVWRGVGRELMVRLSLLQQR